MMKVGDVWKESCRFGSGGDRSEEERAVWFCFDGVYIFWSVERQLNAELVSMVDSWGSMALDPVVIADGECR